MYSKELDELIENVIVDGVITDQEKVVLRQRAEACGENPDEVIIVAEGRLAQIKKAKSPIRHGNIVKCPNCGAPVEAGTVKCKECGFEFNNVKANETIQKFTDELNKLKNSKFGFLGNMMNEDKISSFIENYPIPTSADDLYEMLLLSKQHANKNGEEEDVAYWKMFSRCIDKIKNSGLQNDSRFASFITFYNEQQKKKNWGGFWGVIILIIIFGGICTGLYIMMNDPSSEKENTKQVQNENTESVLNKQISSVSEIQEKIDKQYNELSKKLDELPEASQNNIKGLRDQLRQIIWVPITTEAETAKKTFKSPSDDEKYERAKKDTFYKLVKVKAESYKKIYDDAFNENDPVLDMLATQGYEE